MQELNTIKKLEADKKELINIPDVQAYEAWRVKYYSNLSEVTDPTTWAEEAMQAFFALTKQ